MKNSKIETLKEVLKHTQRVMDSEISKMANYTKEIEKSRSRMISLKNDLEYLESIVARIENDEA